MSLLAAVRRLFGRDEPLRQAYWYCELDISKWEGEPLSEHRTAHIDAVMRQANGEPDRRADEE